MTIDQAIKKIVQMRDERDWMQFHNPKNMAISVTLESNEVLEHFKNVDNIESVEYAKQFKSKISEEIADTANYLLELAYNSQIDMNKLFEDIVLNESENIDPKTMAINLVLQSNELLECFQWKTLEESEEFILENKSKLQEKISDVLSAILKFTNYLGLDLAEIMSAKVDKNLAKYPAEKSRGNAKKYNEL
jgi:NTP pyrophosphatase (non-canonical NTP hydrolase)